MKALIVTHHPEEGPGLLEDILKGQGWEMKKVGLWNGDNLPDPTPFPGTIEEVLRALELMRGKVTMVIVEQNLAVVSRLADRIYCMKEGHIPAELSESADIQNQACLETYL